VKLLRLSIGDRACNFIDDFSKQNLIHNQAVRFNLVSGNKRVEGVALTQVAKAVL
jgi:hypothetical protein